MVRVGPFARRSTDGWTDGRMAFGPRVPGIRMPGCCSDRNAICWRRACHLTVLMGLADQIALGSRSLRTRLHVYANHILPCPGCSGSLVLLEAGGAGFQRLLLIAYLARMLCMTVASHQLGGLGPRRRCGPGTVPGSECESAHL